MSKTILIISHIVPEPANAGNSLRIRNLIRFFKLEGFEVICLFKGKHDKQRVMSDVKGLIDKTFFASDFNSLRTLFNKPYQLFKILERGNAKAYFNDLHLYNATRILCDQYSPDVVIAEYIFMGPYLKYVPDAALKIIDTHDVFARKAEEVCKHGVEFPLACTEEEERKYLLNGDLILGIQAEETAMLQEMVPEKDVITVGVDMPLKSQDAEGLDSSKIVLFVGGGNPNNVHGIEEFLSNSWNVIYDQYSDVSLRIVGSVCKRLDISNVPAGVKLVGIVDDLEAEYMNSTVVINPVVAGTGLKIKTIEAMCYGKPLVSTPNGVEGIPVKSADLPFKVADSSKAFVDIIIQLLYDDEKRNKISKNAIDYVSKYFSTEYVYRDLNTKLDQYGK